MTLNPLTAQLKAKIREISRLSKPGILFYDITTLLKDKAASPPWSTSFPSHYIGQDLDLVRHGARGFIFAPAVAYRSPRICSRAQAGEAACGSYQGQLRLGIWQQLFGVPKDAIQKGQRVVIVDDLLATGGTAEATVKLAQSLGAEIVGLAFVVELDFLEGAGEAEGHDVFSLLNYDK